ncbi:hypothetical protein LPJ57_007143, partial [Coemansia sp. RSA 486]
RKAQYILQELIKYQSYADVLQKALKQMQEELAPAIPEEPMTAASIAAPDSSIASSSPAMGSSSINGAYHQGHSHSQNHGHQYSPQQHSQQQQHRVVPAGEAGYGHEEIDGHATASQQHAYHHSHGRASTSGPNSSVAAAATLSASRASLPQAGGRRTTDSNGNPTSSKALPIKELLAPASEKARNRASIISPTSASSTATTATMTPLSAAGAAGTVDEKRRASHPHVTAMSAVSSPVPDS